MSEREHMLGRDWKDNMKLCQYCITNILEGKESWEYHHQSYAFLEKSCAIDTDTSKDVHGGQKKKERCLFCSTLKTDVDNLAPHLQRQKYTKSWPAYRWNIRSLSRIRESLEAIVVTFRYVPPANHEDRDTAVDIVLPTRTFFLFPEEGEAMQRDSLSTSPESYSTSHPAARSKCG
jgi:hypothetical protein